MVVVKIREFVPSFMQPIFSPLLSTVDGVDSVGKGNWSKSTVLAPMAC
jgi:hypothetical protein